MFKSLEELRVQRELVRKHLDWLDAQIERVENVDQVRESTIEKNHPQNPGFENKKLLKSVDTPNLLVSNIETVADKEDDTPLLSDASNIKQAKFGCIVFFAIITLLFLFLLFALPYMINWTKEL